jgi:hypothetical protein
MQMQRAGRISSLGATVGAVITLLVAMGSITSINAQYLISSKAGFVNRVDGRVFIERQENANSERGRASLGTQMKDGDLLATAVESRAEVLLNPGSYIRLGEQTEVRAVNTSLSEMRFEVVKGSVIVEVGELEKQIVVEIQTPAGVISVNKSGIQRIDVTNGVTTIAVRQGEAYLGTRDQLLAKRATKIGRGKMTRLSNTFVAGSQLQMAKIDKDATIDELDAWSFNRAQTLMAANQSVLRRQQQSRIGLISGWYFDPFYNGYTFIPGGGYFSPYGFPFFSRYGDFRYYFPYGVPYYYYNPYGWGNGNNGGGGGGRPGGGAPPSSRVIAGHDRAPIQRSMEGRGVSVGNSGFGADSPSYRGGGGSVSTSAPVSTGTVTAPSAPASGGSSSGGAISVGRPGRP